MIRRSLMCLAPFTEVEIDEFGEVNCCCFEYTTNHYSFGNINKEPFGKIWNGEKAKKLRKDILDGKYSFCKRNICNFGRLRIYRTSNSLTAEYPLFVTIGYDTACNLKCITCRDKIIRDNNQISDKELEKTIKSKFLPILKNAQELTINSVGECLVSKHSKMLIKMASQKFPDLKFNIITNGTLCSEYMVNNLGLNGRMSAVQFSIHASTKKTYNKITRTGNFDAVMKNLKWIANQKKQGKINDVIINFVVHSLNYKEMVKFVKLAKQLDVTACFWEFQNWDTDKIQMCRDYEQYAVFDEKHPEHKNLLEILKDPIFEDSKHCLLGALFKNLRDKALS